MVANKKVSLNLTMSYYGEWIIPVPTVLLSNTPNTPFATAEVTPFCTILKSILQEFRANNAQAIVHLGYFYNESHMPWLAEILDEYKSSISLLVSDPVMGDHGQFYINTRVIPYWKQWVYQSCWAFPNLTELKVLCGFEPNAALPLNDLTRKFRLQYPKTRLLITGINTSNGIQISCVTPHQVQHFTYPTDLPNQSGTGDLFTIGFLYYHCIQQKTLEESIKLSHERVVQFIQSLL